MSYPWLACTVTWDINSDSSRASFQVSCSCLAISIVRRRMWGRHLFLWELLIQNWCLCVADVTSWMEGEDADAIDAVVGYVVQSRFVSCAINWSSSLLLSNLAKLSAQCYRYLRSSGEGERFHLAHIELKWRWPPSIEEIVFPLLLLCGTRPVLFAVNTTQDLHIKRIRLSFGLVPTPKLKAFSFETLLPELTRLRYNREGIFCELYM